MRYLRRVNSLPFISALLVLINVAVFVICLFVGEELHYLGGVQKTGILEHHEYLRLLWAMFLHADEAHLANNMIVLFFLGSMLEKEVGHAWFAVIYMLSGVGGNIASLAYKVAVHSEGLSIGASGAVFGLDGLLLALVLFSIDFRNTVPPVRVFLMIALSLYDGFMSQNIDNAAHVGGLAIGFLAGLCYAFWQKAALDKNRERCGFEH